MTVQSRQTKVLVALLVSIIVGAIILNAFGHNPPSAGAFCLSWYYDLIPIEKSIYSRATQYPGRWKKIEIYYSGSDIDNQAMPSSNSYAKQFNATRDIASYGDLNCHFIICNGQIGRDGLIKATENWQMQQAVNPESSNQKRKSRNFEQNIYICIIANGKIACPTNYQIKRTEELLEKLCQKFRISPESIHFPKDWQ